MLLPVSHLLMSLPSEGQSLSGNQILSTYLNLRLRKKNVRHIGILLPVWSRPLRRNRRVFLHQSTDFRPNPSTHCENMTSYPFIKMAATTAKCYFRFRICWRSKFIRKPNFVDIPYLNLQLRKNKRPPYWNSTSGFDLDYFAVIGVFFCIRLPNFVQIGAPIAKIWRHIHFSRWRPQSLNTTSDFVFVDVTAFGRTKSIRKPNFVDITQFTTKI